MSEIEEVARAICASDFDGDESVYDTMSEGQRQNFTTNARAALLAIREPTLGMKLAVVEELSDVTVQEPKAAAWDWLRAHKAAIDHALTQETSE